MGEKTGIEWSDSTFNPWIGCTKLGPGCDHCYAEQRMDKRLHVVNWGTGQPRKRTSEKNWSDPKKWEREQWLDVGRPDYWDSMDGAIDDQQCMGRVGKKAAGRLLDGREHNGFPA